MRITHFAKPLKLFSLIGFPLLVALFALIYWLDPSLYIDLLNEDRIAEWLTFSLLLFAGFLAIDIGVQIRHYERIFHWFFFAFALFCIFAAFEEISWGERVFDIHPPEFFFEESDQQEISFHNILQQQVPIKTKTLVGLGLFLYGVLLPLLTRIGRVRQWVDKLRIVVPPFFLLPGFLLAALLMIDIPSGWKKNWVN